MSKMSSFYLMNSFCRNHFEPTVSTKDSTWNKAVLHIVLLMSILQILLFQIFQMMKVGI